jgi:hypothetical protein
MGGGSTDDSGGENVRSGNDDRADQLDLSTSGGAELPDFEELDPDDTETAPDESADLDALLDEAEGVAAVTDGEPDDPESGGADGDTTRTGDPLVDVEEVLIDAGDRDSFTAEELRDEATAEAFGDWVNRNVRRANVGDEYVDQIRRLAADDIDADVPEALDLDRGVEYTPMLSADDPSGASEVAMWVVQTDDGDELYVTLDTGETAGNTMESAAIVDEVSSSLETSAADTDVATPSFPDVTVDEEREASVMESAGAEDASPVSRYRQGGEDHSAADYRAAVAGKVLIADTDIGGNVVTSSDGDFHPIDFDLAGGDLARKDDRIADATSGINENYDSIWDKVAHRATTNTRSFDYDYDSAEMGSHTRSLARAVDTEALERRLTDNANISRRQAENVIDNVRALKRGDL